MSGTDEDDEGGNPFEQTMQTLYIPPGMGPTISAGGFTIKAKKDGSVSVPKSFASELQAHGLLTSPAKAAA